MRLHAEKLRMACRGCWVAVQRDDEDEDDDEEEEDD
jgi:hypothetical protein